MSDLQKRPADPKAIFPLFFVVTLSVPVAFYGSYNIYSSEELPDMLRYVVLITILGFSLLLFYRWILLFWRDTRSGFVWAMVGSTLRMILVMVIGVWVWFYYFDYLRPAMVTSLIAAGSFLFFEVAGIITYEFYARKRFR